MSQETLSRAWEVLQDAYQAQMEGDYDRAVELYQSSLDLYPTAEAHTFLGWTYHFQGRLDDAISECKRAIEIDPEFGNPYNDIGAYLIEKNRFDEAIPWLERAVEAARYEPRHFPHYNLGRAYLGKEMYAKAIDCFQQALSHRTPLRPSPRSPRLPPPPGELAPYTGSCYRTIRRLPSKLDNHNWRFGVYPRQFRGVWKLLRLDDLQKGQTALSGSV